MCMYVHKHVCELCTCFIYVPTARMQAEHGSYVETVNRGKHSKLLSSLCSVTFVDSAEQEVESQKLCHCVPVCTGTLVSIPAAQAFHV